MNGRVKAFAKEHFQSASSDLFAAFIDRSFVFLVPAGYSAMVTMQSWMFLSSYESMRQEMLTERTIVSMAHIGSRGFETIGGDVVQTTAFVVKKSASVRFLSSFMRLLEFRNEESKAAAIRLCATGDKPAWEYRIAVEAFKRIPGSPIAYWLSEAALSAFEHPRLEEKAAVCIGMKTGDNPFFLRLWHEVSRSSVGLDLESLGRANDSQFRWFPYLKGGNYRKWYGNYDHILRWVDSGQEILGHTNSQGISDARIRPLNFEYYFRPGVSWSFIASGSFAVRLHGDGFFFDVAGSSLFPVVGDDLYYLAGFLNSKVAETCLAAINPTLNIQIENIKDLPITPLGPKDAVIALVSEMRDVAQADWDDAETSWAFRNHPFMRSGERDDLIATACRRLLSQRSAAIERMQTLETENNRLFLEAYGMRGDIDPAVPADQITLAHADTRRDIVTFLSYGVACIMGRYSLDKPGLILADAGDGLAQYLARVARAPHELSFIPDEDAIVPLLDDEWFADDIVARTREFLKATFGEATLRENIRFIEESLGRDLRSYFLTDFYKDHLQTYKKRPIYWMVQSPRKGFSVLIYLHRYTRDTMNVILNRYLREFQVKLRSKIEHLQQVGTSASASNREKTLAAKELTKLTKTLHECEEWERQTILPLAQARIELDLDDGVKVNYLKLGEALAPIPGLAAAEE